MNNFEKIANDDEIILIEKNAIKSGLKETTLIKRAGTKIFDYLYKNIEKNKKILFVLGKRATIGIFFLIALSTI